MSKASILQVINIWFSSRIPIGSRRILSFPTFSDCRNSSDPTSDNFLSESDRKESDNFRRNPIGSCQIVWGFLQDPTVGLLVLGLYLVYNNQIYHLDDEDQYTKLKHLKFSSDTIELLGSYSLVKKLKIFIQTSNSSLSKKKIRFY